MNPYTYNILVVHPEHNLKVLGKTMNLDLSDRRNLS